MYRLLVVDDEPHILNALRREMHGEYEIEAFTAPQEALRQAETAHFDLAIADYKMPRMNGIQFLKRFGRMQPDAMRLVLSGAMDIDALMRAINETHIFRFVAKPWDADELRGYVRQALLYRNIVLENRRLADALRPAHAPSAERPGERPYRVVLADGADGLLKAMWQALAQPSAQEGLYEALRREIGDNDFTVTRELRFAVETPATAAAALAGARNNRCDLVVAARALPDMDGIRLLAEFKKIRPDAARFLVSDRVPDKRMLSQAINDLQVHTFLDASSWKTQELKANTMRRTWLTYQFKTAVFQAVTTGELLAENERLAELARRERP
jgi:response regulator RpfG family c-di-GMP phosphodiesterase